MTNRPTIGRICIAAIALLVPAAGALAQDDDGVIRELPEAYQIAGWQLLFDGASTDNFRGYKKEDFPTQGWIVEDGMLKVTVGGGGGDLITRGQYGDFDLYLEYKVAKGANSGIMYRLDERHGASWQTGPEFQILDDEGYGVAPTDMHAAGALYDLYKPMDNKVSRPAGEWNEVRIRIKDGRVTHFLNDEVVVRADMNSEDWASRIAGSKFASYDGFGVLPKGHIALQDHGNDVWFRNIMIRDLDEPMRGEAALISGDDLSGLNTVFRGESDAQSFSVADGVLQCTGNPIGYIQTDASYTSFVTKFEWRWPDNPGNSGLLLRKTGEDKVWPKSLEVQLYADHAGDLLSIDGVPMTGDPERTEGRVISKSHAAEFEVGEWNEMEVVVLDEMCIVFVNGEIVNRATGFPAEAGTICLQSEGAPIEFRNWRVAEID